MIDEPEQPDNVVKFPSPAGLVSLSDLPERQPLVPWYSGFTEWRKRMMFAPGTLVVVTGHPGHGKSSLIGNVVFNTASINNLGVIVATFENYPIPSYRKMLRQFWAGMPEAELGDKQRRAADAFINDHYRFLIDPQERPTIGWILEWAAKGGNFNILVIDPWNRIESQRNKDETETEYIAYCLSELRRFAVRHNCLVIVIAHPAKRDARYRERVPVLEDISGSKNWDNMPDQGLVINRDKFWDDAARKRLWNAKVYHLKSRFEELGYPCEFDIRLNPQTWRFETIPPASVS